MSAPDIQQTNPRPLAPGTLVADLKGGLVVSLVALPLCLGIALASGAPIENRAGLSLMSGLLAGIVGGIVVGSISGSRPASAVPRRD